MKTIKRFLLLVGFGAFCAVAGTATSNAGISVGIGLGIGGPIHGGYYHGGYYPSYYGHYGWCARPTVVYASPYYVAPAPVYVDPAPVTVVQAEPAPAPVVVQSSSVPYGFIQPGGVLKSPYSSFSMGVGGHSSGDVVYDANNGKPFKIP